MTIPLCNKWTAFYTFLFHPRICANYSYVHHMGTILHSTHMCVVVVMVVVVVRSDHACYHPPVVCSIKHEHLRAYDEGT